MKKLKLGTLRDKISWFLFAYRNIPQSTTDMSPAELLLGRKMWSPWDLLKPDLRQRVETEQTWQKNAHDQHSRLRSFQPGDTVYAKNLVLQQLRITSSGCQVTSQTVLVFYPTRSYRRL